MLTSDLHAYRHLYMCAHAYRDETYNKRRKEKSLCHDSGMQEEGINPSVSQTAIHCGPQRQLLGASDASALLCFLGNCCPPGTCLSPFLLAPPFSSFLSPRPLQQTQKDTRRRGVDPPSGSLPCLWYSGRMSPQASDRGTPGSTGDSTVRV